MTAEAAAVVFWFVFMVVSSVPHVSPVGYGPTVTVFVMLMAPSVAVMCAIPAP